ncbi:MAG: Phosphoribosyl-ATP pyrophosphatase [Candidatus Gottesmanbacteria bacterium GW2011_GWC2_39_8]|uniref:Phosphoribosyl-ATP pyrophosphatase n=1 Tax=Candidatus Gottesmanbacteria bacterium GW2011_GWC2_39_8 TaxID=1618450 RepID=A0A0G0S520_9BACT|nr:MAG: Phosphoribosyl-ATP pyrophosphatase [Candidatus Gottesmanbacteria bacterium GW2011_GWC2_39_8]
MTIEELFMIIEKRKKEAPENSYVTSVFNAGEDRVIQKVGEEATEVVIAAKNNRKKEIVSEMADLWFHSLILLSLYNINPEDIFAEFEKRRK